jgi:hypothetical protein
VELYLAVPDETEEELSGLAAAARQSGPLERIGQPASPFSARKATGSGKGIL